MRVAIIAMGLLASVVSSVQGTALTYMVGANEKACFYANADQTNLKMAFYFAVSRESREGISDV